MDLHLSPSSLRFNKLRNKVGDRGQSEGREDDDNNPEVPVSVTEDEEVFNGTVLVVHQPHSGGDHDGHQHGQGSEECHWDVGCDAIR